MPFGQMELVKFLERADKRVLQNALGVFRSTYEPGENWVETVLIAPDQKAKCLTLAGAARLHQAVIVFTPGHRNVGRSHRPRSSCKKRCSIEYSWARGSRAVAVPFDDS